MMARGLSLAAVLWLASGIAVAEAPTAAPAAATDELPFVLGKTTLDEARSIFASHGMEIQRSGYLGLGTGSGIDGYSNVVAERVLLLDVSNFNLEGFPLLARFAFFDNTLYRVQAQMQSGILYGKKEPDQLTDEQVAQVEARLAKKYGRPDAEQFKVKMWKRKGTTITFRKDRYVITNDESEAAIKKYRKEYCKTINTKERRTCW